MPITDRHILGTPVAGLGHEIYGVLGSADALAVFRQSFTDGGSLLAAEAADARADTGYAVIESVTETTFSSDATAHAVAMPATVNAGDGLIVFLTTDGDATVTTPGSWDRIYTTANGAALRARLAAAKVHYLVGALDNDPAQSSLDVSADGETQWPHRVLRQQYYVDYLEYWERTATQRLKKIRRI